ncbi:MAG: DUF512 domain-containing protein [Myxococcales bacterium]|nr:DUF512 domain-containing protein [Myxococcales bacterium]
MARIASIPEPRADRGIHITAVDPGSPAERAGVGVGEWLVRINDQPIQDPLDARFHQVDAFLRIELGDGKGGSRTVLIEKGEAEDLGLDFQILSPRSCNNDCVFCFVDQLPQGLRSTLYIRDDDYRFSFLHGNFVTLTNLRAGELDKIIAQRLSPLNVSVHATDVALRRKMLGNPEAEPVMDVLRRLAEGGVTVHTQIVLCPGWNDGPELEETVRDLSTLWPRVESISIVPVGLTLHREGLPPLTRATPAYARAMIERIRPLQDELARALDFRHVHLSDEWYLVAQAPFPPFEEYEDFPQIENGVGLVSQFREELAALNDPGDLSGLEGDVVTGVLAAPIVGEFVAWMNRAGARMRLRPIPNRLFGSQVTVTGLIAGKDIVAELGAGVGSGVVLLPAVTLRPGIDELIDRMTVEALSAALGRPVWPVSVFPDLALREVEEFFQKNLT